MKSNILKVSFLLCVISVAIGAEAANAQEVRLNSRINGAASTSPLRARIENNMDANRDIRNVRAEDSKIMKGRVEERKDINMEKRGDIKDLRTATSLVKRDIKASSTMMFKAKVAERKEVVQKMRKDAFEIRKGALVKQLTITIENLTNIKTRINERISKLESEGKTVTEAKASLVIAEGKLATAKVAVDAFIASNIAASTTAETEVELEKPRKVADEAIKAIREARDAFKKTVMEIAKISKRNNDGATTTSTTN